MRAARRQFHDQAGFTLLELMVVLAIVGLVSVLVYPRGGGAVGQASFRAAALGLNAQVRTTRMAAIRGNTEHTLTIDAATKRYWSSVDPTVRGLAPVMVVDATGRGLEHSVPALSTIRFHPNGSVGDIDILLKGRSTAARLSIDWMTGGVRINWNP